jgi:signal transduction histidine kinase
VQVRNRTEELEQRNRDVLRQSEQLRQLSHSLMQLQDNERRYIARELHDSAGQILTALGMNLASIARQTEQLSPDLFKQVEEGQQMVQELTQEIRTTSYLLHPPLLDETGLHEALHMYAGGLKDRSDLDITLDVAADFERLPREMELVIFRIVQECLTNIHRHSGSKVATIRMARKPHSVLLEIEDKGKGISPQRLVEIQLHGAGVGMRGIRERVLQFGGQMKIQSDGGGTRIAIALPLAKSEHSGMAGYVRHPQAVAADSQD